MQFFTISDAIVLSVRGRHAERYLQARLSNDMKTLPVGGVRLAAALSPQGRTEGLFTVLRESSTEFALIADGGDRSAVSAALARFKVAEQLDIIDDSENGALVHLVGGELEQRGCEALSLAAPPALPDSPRVTLGASTRTTGSPVCRAIRRARSTAAGLDILIPRSNLAPFLTHLRSYGGVELSHSERAALRIGAGLPQFPGDVNDSVILSEAGLPDAVSFTKGCYVGQEVIAKIDALGKPPRLLYRLASTGRHDTAPGDEVKTVGGEEKTLGKITSAGYDAPRDSTVAFALLKNDPNGYADGVTVGGNRWVVE